MNTQNTIASPFAPPAPTTWGPYTPGVNQGADRPDWFDPTTFEVLDEERGLQVLRHAMGCSAESAGYTMSTLCKLPFVDGSVRQSLLKKLEADLRPVATSPAIKPVHDAVVAALGEASPQQPADTPPDAGPSEGQETPPEAEPKPEKPEKPSPESIPAAPPPASPERADPVPIDQTGTDAAMRGEAQRPKRPGPAEKEKRTASDSVGKPAPNSADRAAELRLNQIVRDEGIQPREKLDDRVVADYAEGFAQGAHFPPVIVFHGDDKFWLADGFHRTAAAEKVGLEKIDAEIREGTRRDAMLFSVGANATHGLRRTNADKRRAVTRLVQDEEWAGWSSEEIARRCCVSHTLVNNMRQELTRNDCESKRRVLRSGKEIVMDTANIGHKSGGTEPGDIGHDEPGPVASMEDAGLAPKQQHDPAEPDQAKSAPEDDASDGGADGTVAAPGDVEDGEALAFCLIWTSSPISDEKWRLLEEVMQKIRDDDDGAGYAEITTKESYHGLATALYDAIPEGDGEDAADDEEEGDLNSWKPL
jgi:hypothetical protein